MAWDRMEWIPFVSPPVDFLDVVGNVLFYAPYGFHILSISTELTRIFSNSRFPSMTDVVCNAIGAFAGAYWRHPGDEKIDRENEAVASMRGGCVGPGSVGANQKIRVGRAGGGIPGNKHAPLPERKINRGCSRR